MVLIEADPEVFHTTTHYDGYPTVLVRLAQVDCIVVDRPATA